MWRSGKGFTLIELMVVIAIILILALIAVPAYRNMQIRAKKARVQEDLRNIATALEAFYVDWNVYPGQDDGTNPDPTQDVTATTMTGKIADELTGAGGSAVINASGNTTATGEAAPITYIKSIPDDPFSPGNKYYYQVGGTNHDQYWIWSVGPNGTNDSHAGDDIVRSNQ